MEKNSGIGEMVKLRFPDGREECEFSDGNFILYLRTASNTEKGGDRHFDHRGIHVNEKTLFLIPYAEKVVVSG